MLRRTPSGDGLSPAWSSSAELAGHNAPVATSRFSSQIYNATATASASAAAASSSAAAPTSSSKHLSAVALGSADGVVTVWRTDKPRPVVVLRDCFHDAITDLAWTPDGYNSRHSQYVYMIFMLVVRSQTAAVAVARSCPKV